MTDDEEQEAEHAKVFFHEAEALYKEGWYDKARLLFEALAKDGHAGAQYYLGEYFEYGGNKQLSYDINKAFEWYLKAAEQGHLEAQKQLGYIYRTGRGVEIDTVKSAEWYLKAAEQGDADSQHTIGLCYWSGSGVPPDYVKAAEWFRKAKEQGHEMAELALTFLMLEEKSENN